MKKLILPAVIIMAGMLFLYILKNSNGGGISNIETSKTSGVEIGHAGASGDRDVSGFFDANAGYEVEITGTLRRIGSARANEYVITSPDGVDHYIEASREEKDKLMHFQGKKAKIRGKLEIKKFVYPNPLYNHEKRFIFPETLEIN